MEAKNWPNIQKVGGGGLASAHDSVDSWEHVNKNSASAFAAITPTSRTGLPGAIRKWGGVGGGKRKSESENNSFKPHHIVPFTCLEPCLQCRANNAAECLFAALEISLTCRDIPFRS